MIKNTFKKICSAAGSFLKKAFAVMASFFKKAFGDVVCFFKKTADDGVPAYSSDTALFIIVSFFPFLMFLLTLLQFLPFTQKQLMEVIGNFVPSQVAQLIGVLVDELYSTTSLVLSLTIILTLWTASRGILGFYRGLNRIYGIKETRNYLVLRLWVMLYTLVFVVMLLMLLCLYVFGGVITRWLTKEFPILMMNRYTLLVVSFRSIIGIVILTVFFLVMYEGIPNRRSKLITELPGALIAASGWVLFSYFYSFYINNMGSLMTTYGSLTAIVLCMLWLYFCMNIVFLGAELNSWLQLKSRERKRAAEEAA
ncbi:MAG: YihY/virulence factor BrkB family protein [Lachnospiraceae bacterium]|nr:YihY/virulence factor BrkB family protein [Lachnospiraceae bacterium]